MVTPAASFNISIRGLAEKIAHLAGFTGHITWDTSKPNGQPRRSLDVSRAEAFFGFKATTSFDQGLKTTIDWYLRTSRKALAL
jgi:GDP-L-fucose synthase